MPPRNCESTNQARPPPLQELSEYEMGMAPPPLPSLPFRSQVVSPYARPSVSFLVACCAFCFVPGLTREETKNAFHWNGHRPEGRDGNGNETEGRKDGNGNRNETGEREREGWPSFLFPSFLSRFPSFPPFSLIRTRERKQNFVSVHPLFFAVHPDFLSVRRKRAFRSIYLFHICKQKTGGGLPM